MRIGKSILRSRDQSARSINNFSNNWPDLGSLLNLTLPQFYDRVRNVRFKLDPRGKEITARPKHLINPRLFQGMDCKKKAVLVQAYLKGRGIKTRLVGLSERADGKIHHIFPQAKFKVLGNKWLNVDSTYPYYSLFAPKPKATRAQVLA